MSLKGYEWLNDQGDVVMMFLLKDRFIHILADTTLDELHKFRDFLASKGWEEYGLNFNNHKVEGWIYDKQ